MTPRLRFDLAPLAHPLWWAGLALLLINDNLLKGHGVVPGWLTGKLSDFAFLVVAPVVFAAMLPRGVPGRRPLAIAAVVGVFVAADLSPAVSDAVVALAARVGLRWKLWPDATDLVALAVLPVTIHLLYRRNLVSSERALWMRERAGVVLGAAACLATSAPPDYAHNPFLLNATGAAANVRVTWVLRSVGRHQCDAAATVAASLNANDLDDPRDLGLASGQVAALDGPGFLGMSPVGTCSRGPDAYSRSYDCVAAILEAPSAAPVLMVAPGLWSESESGGFFQCSSPPAPVSLCQPTLDPRRDPGPDAVTLKDVGGERRFVAGAKVEIFPIDLAAVAARTPDPAGCRSLREQYRSLVTSSTCTSNADCVGRAGLMIPSEPSVCGIYVPQAMSSSVDELEDQWMSSCLIEHPRCDGYPQPAVCRNGTCAPACPDVIVPSCPGRCATSERIPTSGACYGAYACVAPDGKHCSCVDGGDACVDPPPAGPGCPLSCLVHPGGGTLPD